MRTFFKGRVGSRRVQLQFCHSLKKNYPSPLRMTEMKKCWEEVLLSDIFFLTLCHTPLPEWVSEWVKPVCPKAAHERHRWKRGVCTQKKYLPPKCRSSGSTLQKGIKSGINVSQLLPCRAASSHSPRRLYRQNVLSMSSHCWRGRPTRRCPIGFQCGRRGNHLSQNKFTA